MDHKARVVNSVIALKNISVEIDLDEIGGSHLAEIKPKRIEQEMPIRAGNACRNMRVKEIIVAVESRKRYSAASSTRVAHSSALTLSLTEVFSAIACTAIVLFSNLVTQIGADCALTILRDARSLTRQTEDRVDEPNSSPRNMLR